MALSPALWLPEGRCSQSIQKMLILLFCVLLYLPGRHSPPTSQQSHLNWCMAWSGVTPILKPATYNRPLSLLTPNRHLPFFPLPGISLIKVLLEYLGSFQLPFLLHSSKLLVGRVPVMLDSPVMNWQTGLPKPE